MSAAPFLVATTLFATRREHVPHGASALQGCSRPEIYGSPCVIPPSTTTLHISPIDGLVLLSSPLASRQVSHTSPATANMSQHHHHQQHGYDDFDYDYEDVGMDQPAFTGNVSYSSSRRSQMVDPQLASSSSLSYHQPSTSQWLPVATSGYQSVGTSSQAGYGWGNDPQRGHSSLMDPMVSAPATQGRSGALPTSSYTSGHASAWGTNQLGQPSLQGGLDNFPPFQNASATAQGTTSTSRRGAASGRGSAADAESRRGQTGAPRGGRPDVAPDFSSHFSPGDYYLPQTSGPPQSYGSGLMNYSTQYTSSAADTFFFPSTAPPGGASRAALQAAPALSLTEDLLFSHNQDLLSAPLAGSSTHRERPRQYASSAYSASDDEPSVTASLDAPLDGQASTSYAASRQPSPGMPSSSQKKSGKGKEKETHTLKCTFDGCTSKAVFTRQCDLAKHFRQHFRKYQCRVEGCQASAGFATKKDRARHERTHNPSILCEHCGRKFSRQDNLRDHIRRRH